MSKRQAVHASEDDNSEHKRILHETIQLAMQASATVGGAPRTCRRNACRLSGSCQMRIGGEKMIDCSGRLDIGLVTRAEAMMAFLRHLLDHWPRPMR